MVYNLVQEYYKIKNKLFKLTLFFIYICFQDLLYLIGLLRYDAHPLNQTHHTIKQYQMIVVLILLLAGIQSASSPMLTSYFQSGFVTLDLATRYSTPSTVKTVNFDITLSKAMSDTNYKVVATSNQLNWQLDSSKRMISAIGIGVDSTKNNIFRAQIISLSENKIQSLKIQYFIANSTLNSYFNATNIRFSVVKDITQSSPFSSSSSSLISPDLQSTQSNPVLYFYFLSGFSIQTFGSEFSFVAKLEVSGKTLIVYLHGIQR